MVLVSTEKKQPIRKCVGCGEVKNKKELIRVLKNTEGQFMIDVTGRLNGRGAYVCRDVNCLKKAIKSKGLERSFKMQIDNSIYEALEKEFDELDK